VSLQVTVPKQPVPRPHIDQNGQLRLPYELLQTLTTSARLQLALQDHRLREVISHIDNSGPLSADTLDTRLRTDSDFVAFVDLLLKEIGLRDQQGLSTIDG